MHRARNILNTVVGPQGQKFAAWLLAKNPPAVTCIDCRKYNVPAAAEPFLNGSSSQYVEDMYNAWLADPSSVHAVSSFFFTFICHVLLSSWQILFLIISYIVTKFQ